MKSYIVILLFVSALFSPCYTYGNDCFNAAVKAKNDYFNSEYQTKTKENKQRNSNNKSELRMRNWCLSNFLTIHLNCGFYKCAQSSFVPISMNRNLTGEQICGYIESVDCLNDNISDINHFLREAGDTFTDMFLFDMNKTIAKIKSNNVPLSYIDANKEVCYSIDNNGDTVWHAFVETENSSFTSWFNQCVSVLDADQKQYLYYAILFATNKANKTAIQLAYENHKSYYLEKFNIIGYYFKQEKIDCQPYVDSVSEQSGIRKADLNTLCGGTSYKLW